MKTTLWATAIALGALCTTACTDTDDNNPDAPDTSQPRLVPMTMHATTGEPETRAHYTPGTTRDDMDVMYFSWDAGDLMSVQVMDGTTNPQRCLEAQSAGKSADFLSGPVPIFMGTKKIRAVYPYKTGYTYTFNDNDETVELTLENPQKFTVGDRTGGRVENSYLVGAGTAITIVSGGLDDVVITASASMKQVMSFVRLNIKQSPAALKRVTLRSTDGSPIFTTKANVRLSDAVIATADENSRTSELAMDVIDNATKHEDLKEISFALFPQDLTASKITIQLTFANDKVKTLDENRGLNFERNGHYEVNIDASKAAVPAPKVGDYFYADGTTSTEYQSGKNLVGKVFWIDPVDGTKGKIVSLDRLAGKTWSEAQAGTSAYPLPNGMTWRLPTKDELQHLYCAYNGAEPTTWEKVADAPNTDEDARTAFNANLLNTLGTQRYWSSMEGPMSSTIGGLTNWYVDFYIGSTSYSSTSSTNSARYISDF